MHADCYPIAHSYTNTQQDLFIYFLLWANLQVQKAFLYPPMAQEQAQLSPFSLMRRKSLGNMLSFGLKNVWQLKESFLCGKIDLLKNYHIHSKMKFI